MRTVADAEAVSIVSVAVSLIVYSRLEKLFVSPRGRQMVRQPYQKAYCSHGPTIFSKADLKLMRDGLLKMSDLARDQSVGQPTSVKNSNANSVRM